MSDPDAPTAEGDGTPSVTGLVDDLFRRSSARLVAGLTRALGPAWLELAEESVQDAMVRALQSWPWRGVPRDPEAWLARVAKNRALDRLRRRGRWEAETDGDDLEALAAAVGKVEAPFAAGPGSPLDDDELAMVFLCCDPSLGSDAAVALTLRAIGGLSTREIAAAFLTPEATVAQRIVRAKRALRDVARLEIPPVSELPERREAVLRVLYLLFNEGYAATEGDLVVRRELCHEAIRLASLVATHPAVLDPEVDALLALFLLQASRLPARTDASGDLLLLVEQDRSRWDAALRARGLDHLERASRGNRLTTYHLEAGIAACHATAPSLEATDWDAVLELYDLLLERTGSEVVALNRAVAVGMRDGPDAGLTALAELRKSARLGRGHGLASVQGWMLERAGRPGEAARAWRRAAERTRSAPVRRHLEARARAAESPG